MITPKKTNRVLYRSRSDGEAEPLEGIVIEVMPNGLFRIERRVNKRVNVIAVVTLEQITEVL